MKPKWRTAIGIQKTGRSGSAFQVEALEPRRLLAAVAIDTPIHLLTDAKSVVMAGDKAVYINGYAGNATSGGVFDPASGQFTPVALPPDMVAGYELFSNKSVTTVGGNVFLASDNSKAGDVRSGSLDSSVATVHILNLFTNQWSTEHLSSLREQITALTVDQKAIFAGGYAGFDLASDVVDVFDNATHQWTTGHLSQPSYSLTTTVLGDRAYLISTGNSDHPIDVFDAVTGIWSTRLVPSPIFIDSMTAVGNKIVLIGSKYQAAGSSFGSKDRVHAEVYDTITGRWRNYSLGNTGFNPNVGVIGHRAVFLGGEISRGYGGADDFTRVSRVFNADNGKWTYPQPQEGVSSNATISASLPDRLVFARDGVINVYDPASGHWSWSNVPIFIWHDTPVQAVGNRVAVYDNNQVHLLSFVKATGVYPPVVTYPQSDVGASHASFSWSSTPNAFGYAVLIDDQFYAGVHENFWSWDPLTLGPGRHRIHVTALGPRLNLAGPSAEFVVPG